MDELNQQLKSAVDREPTGRDPDLSWVLARGRRLRLFMNGAIGLSIVTVLGLFAVGVAALPSDDTRTFPVTESSPSTETPTPDSEIGVVEELSEQEEAEIFAFRAMADTDLMSPFGGRTYSWTYAEDTTRTDEGWRIGFAASDCEPQGSGKDLVMTCTALSGEEPESGNALTDTYVTVTLQDSNWVVVDVEGKMLPEEVPRIIGYTRPQRSEPSHWEFPAIGTWPDETGVAISMVALWVGPYPTVAPGSDCELETFNVQGEAIGSWEPFFVDPPNRQFERGGWVRVIGPGDEPSVDSARVECRQAAGPRPEKEPPEHVRPTPEGDVYPLGSGIFEGEEWGTSENKEWFVDAFSWRGDPCARWRIASDDPDGFSTTCIPRNVEEEVWGGTFYEAHGHRAVVGGTVGKDVWRVEVEGADTDGYVLTLPVELGAGFHAFILFLPDDGQHTLIAYDKSLTELGRREITRPDR